MDYRELLKKYMWHVLESEGVTFVSEGGLGWSDAPLSKDDFAELETLEAEMLATRSSAE